MAADVDATGRVLAVWQDCRFRPACTANDVVFSRSTDGTTWSDPRSRHLRPERRLPTIGVEPGTGRLAIAYYVIRPNGIDAELVTRRRSRWSAPQRLNPRRMPLSLDARDDARPDARRLHRRQLVARPAARRLRACLAAEQDELRQAIYAARG